MNDDTPMFDFGEDHPVIVSEAEWAAIKRRHGDPNCKHSWTYRRGRPKEQFIVVHNADVEYLELEDGRMCERCDRIEFLAGQRKATRAQKLRDAPKWQQLDLTPKR